MWLAKSGVRRRFVTDGVCRPDNNGAACNRIDETALIEINFHELDNVSHLYSWNN